MAIEKIVLPDVGDFDDIEIIEVLINSGDTVDADESIIILESDKATMEIPTPFAGQIKNVKVKVGDRISEGHEIADIELSDSSKQVTVEATEQPETIKVDEEVVPNAVPSTSIEKIILPDVGDFEDIEVIEVLVNSGDMVEADDAVIILESDKATMDIPTPYAGQIKNVMVKVGDRISEGHEIAEIQLSDSSKTAAGSVEVAEAGNVDKQAIAENRTKEPKAPTEPRSAPVPVSTLSEGPSRKAHASPAIRRFARELGVDISLVQGSGNKGRILREDVQSFVKAALTSGSTGTTGSASGFQLPQIPAVDFSKFGEIEKQELSRIKKISGTHLHRSWINVPHVTQFDEADITDLESFRKSLSKEAEKKGVRLTPLVFIMKAVVSALKEYPEFNSSLDSNGESLILKKYFHLGVAVDTPNGLMVPVIRDVDQKGIYELSEEVTAVAGRARDGKLSPNEMQGGCFSISSLGGIGGTQFTPIVNAPEVAILGVARAKMQPVYQDDGSFKPGLILPLALSYDHRVIDGAQGARFTHFLSQSIADIRRVLL